VGGKTAVNLARGNSKNMAGAFHQPALVLIDPGLLDTLLGWCGRGDAEEIKSAGHPPTGRCLRAGGRLRPRGRGGIIAR
jgi:hypothetical protein